MIGRIARFRGPRSSPGSLQTFARSGQFHKVLLASPCTYYAVARGSGGSSFNPASEWPVLSQSTTFANVRFLAHNGVNAAFRRVAERQTPYRLARHLIGRQGSAMPRVKPNAHSQLEPLFGWCASRIRREIASINAPGTERELLSRLETKRDQLLRYIELSIRSAVAERNRRTSRNVLNSALGWIRKLFSVGCA